MTSETPARLRMNDSIPLSQLSGLCWKYRLFAWRGHIQLTVIKFSLISATRGTKSNSISWHYTRFRGDKERCRIFVWVTSTGGPQSGPKRRNLPLDEKQAYSKSRFTFEALHLVLCLDSASLRFLLGMPSGRNDSGGNLSVYKQDFQQYKRRNCTPRRKNSYRP